MNRDESRRVVEGYLNGHADEWLAEEVELRDMTRNEPIRGRVGVSNFIHRFYGEVFADAVAADSRLTVDDGQVFAEWTFRGRHTGSLLGETPTGAAVAIPMACCYEVASGEIVRARLYYDAVTLMAQLGAVPVEAA